MATLRLEFDHAVQYQTYPNNTSWNVTSGTVVTGGRYSGNYVSYENKFQIYFKPLPFNVGKFHILSSKLHFGSGGKSIFAAQYDDYVVRTSDYDGIYCNFRMYMNSSMLWYFSRAAYGDYSTDITENIIFDSYTRSIFEEYNNDENSLIHATVSSPTGINYTKTGSILNSGSFTEIYNIEQSYLEIEYEPIGISIEGIYPINVNVRNDRKTTFTWDIGFEYERDDLEINKVEIEIEQGGNVQTFESLGKDANYTFDANTFNAGETKYKLKAYSTYGTTSETTKYSFIFIGATNAPEVTEVTQNNYPTITWICDEQKAYELLVKNEFGVIYNSGVVVSEEKSLKLPIMLNDGSYFIEIRALNNFGYYTTWSSYSFVLNPPKPSAIENIIVSANNDFGVSVSCNAETNGTLFVVRRRNEFDYPVVVGEYKKGFVDYTIPLNTPHQYAVRNYVEGYADSEWLDAEIRTEGVVLRDSQDLSQYVHLWKNSEIFDVMSNSTRSDVLINCVGRTYPVKEVGEWIAETKTFNSYVDKEDYRKVVDFNVKSHNIYYQANNEFIPCHIEIQDGGEYLGQGRFVSFKLTRIDGE